MEGLLWAGLEALPPSSSPQTAAFPSGLRGDAPGGGAAGPPPLSPHNPGLGPWCLFREAKGGAGKLVVGG